jgi:hypothetical protein
MINDLLNSLTDTSSDTGVARTWLLDARKELPDNPAGACNALQRVASTGFNMQLSAALSGDLRKGELGAALLSGAVLISEALTQEGAVCRIRL